MMGDLGKSRWCDVGDTADSEGGPVRTGCCWRSARPGLLTLPQPSAAKTAQRHPDASSPRKGQGGDGDVQPDAFSDLTGAAGLWGSDTSHI